MTATMKPLIIINENDDLDALSSNILNLSLESNKQAFFKVDTKIIGISPSVSVKINNSNKRKLETVYFDTNKKKLYNFH